MSKRKVESGPWSRIGEATAILSEVQNGIISHRTDEGAPLAKVLQQVSQGISSWFEPDQEWRLEDLKIRSNMDKPVEPPPFEFGQVRPIIPRMFSLALRYHAEEPPMVGDMAFIRSRPWIRIFEQDALGKKKEPARDILVTINAHNSMDILRNRINELRRLRDGIVKKNDE